MMTLCVCVGWTNMEYAFERPTLPSLWTMQEGTNLIQIKMVALEEASFLLSKKPKCPFVNPVGDDIFAPLKQPLRCAPYNLFGDGTFAPVYKPLDPNV